MDHVAPPMTHPETVWLTYLVAPALTAAAILGLALVLRGPLRTVLRDLLVRRTTRPGAEPIDPALRWTPPIVDAATLTSATIGIAVTLALLAGFALPLFVALLLAGPLTALLLWTVLWALEQRYCAALDRALPLAVGRLATQLTSGGRGNSFAAALRAVVADLDHGPLKAEWTMLLDRMGQPLAAGGLATDVVVVAALAAQTPSPRQATLLGHIEMALDQHDALVGRVQAAYRALYQAEQRRSQAATQLAQMRYSGLAIGLAAVGMFAYLALTQWSRFVLAYQGPLGLIVGGLMAVVLAAPVAGGFLLARADDVDY